MREKQANAAVLARTRNHLLVLATLAVCAAALWRQGRIAEFDRLVFSLTVQEVFEATASV